MSKRLGNVFLILALLFFTGGEWIVLQSVAWMGMVVSYSERAPLKEALTQTFDGRHPCCLCKAIAAAEKSGKKPQFSLRLQKLEFPPLKENLVFTAPSQFELLPSVDSSAQSLIQKPPTPPPRGFFA
ncbi:MAG: hypothetical protein KGJ88_04400 [Verrucomicrobiota bacterium]|nr:hypothetical protein [Verrucomicrobiota bacterium]